MTRSDASVEELTLAANGEMTLPVESFDEDAFWSIGAEAALREDLGPLAARAISEDREERDLWSGPQGRPCRRSRRQKPPA